MNNVTKAGKHKRRRKFDSWLMDVLGHKWGGSASPPLSERKMYVKDDDVYRVFSMIDDGGFVGIGYPDEWHVIMRTKAARMFAWWTFRLWVYDWFGLKSFIWYRALHYNVKGKWKLKPYPNSNRLTTKSSYEEWRKEHNEHSG